MVAGDWRTEWERSGKERCWRLIRFEDALEGHALQKQRQRDRVGEPYLS
jgi:hypothetical protein